jgi:AcrR family transcriptional regulator
MRKIDKNDHDKVSAGRPRDTQATRRILDAALELGLEVGFDGLTIEGVAERAAVGKTTIYRRWPDIWSVVVDAMLDEVTRVAPVRQLETARESLTVSMRLVAKSFRGHHGKILRPLIGRAQIDETLRKTLADRWLLARRKISREIILRGIASGELRQGLDPDIALDALYGPLYHRLLLPYDGDTILLSDSYINALIDTVFGGLERKWRGPMTTSKVRR